MAFFFENKLDTNDANGDWDERDFFKSFAGICLSLFISTITSFFGSDEIG